MLLASKGIELSDAGSKVFYLARLQAGVGFPQASRLAKLNSPILKIIKHSLAANEKYTYWHLWLAL